MLNLFRSLRYRIITSIVMIEVVMLSIMVWANTADIERTHAVRLAQSADLVLSQFTATAGRHLLEADFASLDEYARSVLEHGEIAYITVSDNAGREVLAIGPVPQSRELDEGPAESSDGVYDVSDPIVFGDKVRGRADIGFSLAVMQGTTAEALRRGVGIAAIAVFLSVVAALLIGFGLTANLRTLATAVERFRRGDTDVSAPVHSRDEVGQVASAFNTMVRDRAKAESALRLSEERLRQAIKLAGLGYWIWDVATGRYAYCSEEHGQIHGVSAEEWVARGSPLTGDLRFTDPKDRDEVATAFDALRSGEGFELGYGVITPTGENRFILETAEPVFDENGSVVQIYGASRDVTDMRLAEEQLHQAQKLELVGQLTGGVAHDFNNLLAISMGNLELLGELLEAQPEALSHVEAALGALERGQDLVLRLLAFSRKQTLVPEIVDPNELVAGTVELLGPTLGEAITIETVLAEDLWPISVDRGQLETALVNLAVNARDAMPKGGKLIIETGWSRLDASEARSTADGGYAMIAVRDTGAGMVPEVLERAFDPFFTTKEVGKGTGLGLSMVFGFIKQSGGHVTIESDPGLGTTVKLYLPKAETVPVEKQERPRPAPPRGRGERVLIVEDDSEIRRLIVTHLKDFGYRVDEAADGRSALQIIGEDANFDLLLTDLVLPGGVGGEDIAAKARSLQPALKIAYMTGYAEGMANLAPDCAVLLKPFKKAELARTVREALRRGDPEGKMAVRAPLRVVK
ncbi:MAG: response regulator [Inquilinus sp.]|nr:response regulator [Inquilinus sp.]